MHLPTTTLLWPAETLFAGQVAPPTLTRYDPPGPANGAAVVVCPGGGYTMLADHEGAPVAEWLAGLGITAFVLRYRLGPYSRHPDMLNDAARAVRTVRALPELDSGRVGILGFSAGGHLASTLATQYELGDPNATDPWDRISSRPDLAVLLYPVITLQPPGGHSWSRTQLLGEDAAEELAASLSSHRRVTPETPPTFLFHTADDDAVPVSNSLDMASALSTQGVSFELHVYAHGAHGVGLAPGDPILGTWPAHCAAWLKGRGF